MLILHKQLQSYLHIPIQILLKLFQLVAGILQSPLEETHQIVYDHSPWLQSIQEYLHSINATISISKLSTVGTTWENDQPIMLNIHQAHYIKREQELINSCCVYLKVMTLSDITSDKGDRYLPCAISGSGTTATPTLWSYSSSKLMWPHQPKPNNKAWRLWKQYLQTFTNTNGQLIQPLGAWNQYCHKF
jgi:hypothetical protein